MPVPLSTYAIDRQVSNPWSKLQSSGHLETIIGPLYCLSRTGAFKRTVLKIIEQLLEKVKHELLYDEVLLPWLIEWAEIMSRSAHRGVRQAEHLKLIVVFLGSRDRRASRCTLAPE